MTSLISTAGNVPALPPSAVLVVYNGGPFVPDSRTVAERYKDVWGVPPQNLLGLDIHGQRRPVRVALTIADYEANVKAPIYAKIAELGGLYSSTNPGGIHSVVLCPFISPHVTQTEAQPFGYQNRSLAYYLMTQWPGYTAPAWHVVGNTTGQVPAGLPTTRPDWSAPFFTHLDSMPRDGVGYRLQNVFDLIDRAKAARPWKARSILQTPNGAGLTLYDSILPRYRDNLHAAGIDSAGVGLGSVYPGTQDIISYTWMGVYQGLTEVLNSRGTPRPLDMHLLPGACVSVINSLVWDRYYNPPADFSAFAWGVPTSNSYHYAPDDLHSAGMTIGPIAVTEPGFFGFMHDDFFLELYRRGFTGPEAIWGALPTGNNAMSCLGDPLCAPYAAV